MAGGFFDLPTALVSQTFEPTVRLISSISKGSTTSITVDQAHNYLTGMTVRILVPTAINGATSSTGPVGMTQIDKLAGKIIVTGTTTFTMDIDSTQFDDFAIPGTWPASIGLYPQVVPFAEDASMDTAAVRDILT